MIAACEVGKSPVELRKVVWLKLLVSPASPPPHAGPPLKLTVSPGPPKIRQVVNITLEIVAGKHASFCFLIFLLI